MYGKRNQNVSFMKITEPKRGECNVIDIKENVIEMKRHIIHVHI